MILLKTSSLNNQSKQQENVILTKYAYYHKTGIMGGKPTLMSKVVNT